MKDFYDINDITAEVILASRSYHSPPLYTLKLFMPRMVLTHLLTHRWFSRNTQSNRAVPSDAPRKLYMPKFKTNQAGMVPGEYLDPASQNIARNKWKSAWLDAHTSATVLNSLKVAKQWKNRLTEPFEMVEVLVSSTNWENFYAQRISGEAQDEIRVVAEKIKEAITKTNQEGEVQLLYENQWHLPFVEFDPEKNIYSLEGKEYCLWDALLISQSLTAQISFRKADASLEKAYAVHDKLILPNGSFHGSVFEHQATPITHDILCVMDKARDMLLKAYYKHFNNDMLIAVSLVSNVYKVNNFNKWLQFRNLL